VETFTFEYPAVKPLARRAQVGVVGSGDLEVLVEPSDEARTQIVVRTGIKNFGDTWKLVLDRFFANNNAAAVIKINDFGATPGVVTMRLAQALEVGTSHDDY
jgi:malonate decarboxylase delta subunit